MNKDIAIMREVVVKVTQLLAGKGLKVTQQGSRAFVQPDKNGKPVRVNIPHIPDNATAELLMAIQGFIDHEVAHVLFTEFTYKQAERAKDKRLHSLHNIVEDPLIEKLMAEKFPGAQYNLGRLGEFFLDKITDPELAKVKGNQEEEFNILIVPVVRALSGQKVFHDWLTKNGHWAHPLVAEFMKNTPPATIAALKTMRTSRDSFAIASAMHGVLYPPKPKTPPAPPMTPPAPSKDKGEDKSKEKSENSDGEGSNKELPEDEDDKGAGGEPSSEKSDSEDEDKSESTGEKNEEKDEDENDSEEPSDEGDEPEGDAEEQQREDSGDADGSDEDGGGASDPEEPESDADGDSDDDAGDVGESGQSDSDGEDVDAGAKGAGGKPEGKESASSDGEDADDGGEDEAAGTSGSDSSGDSEFSDAGDPGDAEETDAGAGNSKFSDVEVEIKGDFGSQLGELITDVATEATKDADYTIFTKDFDDISIYSGDDVTDAEFEEFDDHTRHMVAPMQKDIERLMAARSQVLKVPGYRSGKLNGASLYRLRVNDDRVFRRVHEAKSKDTAVGLLIDNSGSMRGSKIKMAMNVGYALSQTLERVGIVHEVMGFTTGRNEALNAKLIQAEEARIGSYFSRCESLSMPIFKGFDERLTPTVKRRFASMHCNGHGMANNIDGECVEIAIHRLMLRKEHRKVLIVLSDGLPSGASNDPGSWRTRHFEVHLKKVVQDSVRSGVEVIGIGIMDRNVTKYYPKSVVLDDLSKLPSIVMGELKRILTA